MSYGPPGPGWWLASDGRWYPPELAAVPSTPLVTAPTYGPAVKPPPNGFAIVSLILGIAWLYWIGSILALVFGYVAIIQIRQNRESGRGLAIAGIVLGWIGVGIGLLILIGSFVAAVTGST